MYGARFPLFVGIGLAFVPVSLVVTLLQGLILHATSVFGVQTGGTRDGVAGFVVLAVGTALTLTALGIVQAASAQALAAIDRGTPLSVLQAYRMTYPTLRPLFGALVFATLVVSLLASSLFALPIAVWAAGRWALIVPVIELEGASARVALRRSSRLVRGRWLKVSSLIVAGALLVVVAGPLVGVALILATTIPFWLVNVLAGVVYAVTMPFVALTTIYAYFDARVRDELESSREPVVLPAEIEFSS